MNFKTFFPSLGTRTWAIIVPLKGYNIYDVPSATSQDIPLFNLISLDTHQFP